MSTAVPRLVQDPVDRVDGRLAQQRREVGPDVAGRHPGVDLMKQVRPKFTDKILTVPVASFKLSFCNFLVLVNRKKYPSMSNKFWCTVLVGIYMTHYYRISICPKTFRPKWSFIKLIPGQLSHVKSRRDVEADTHDVQDGLASGLVRDPDGDLAVKNCKVACSSTHTLSI
jgi:hypothetical protein